MSTPDNSGETGGSPIPGHHVTKGEPQERQYTPSLSEEDRLKSFEIEDERWTTDKQIRDWLKLGLMILVTWAWMLFIYLLEPGLR